MKKILLFLFAFICCFSLIQTPQAASKWPNQCIYEGEYNGRAGFSKANIGSDGKIHFNKISYYKEANGTAVAIGTGSGAAAGAGIGTFFGPGIGTAIGAGIGALVGGLGTAGVTDALPLDLSKVNTKTNATAKIMNYDTKKDIKYYNGQETLKMNLGEYKLKKDIKECPNYLIVVNNQYGKSYMSVLLGDENLKSYIETTLQGTENYNRVFTGRLVDLSEFLADKEETDYGETTCSGILGNMINGEYVEGTTGWLLQIIFNYMKLAAIILIFALSVVDYAKGIINQNHDDLKTASIKFGKRLAFGVVIFLLPLIVDLIVGVIDQSTCGIK